LDEPCEGIAPILVLAIARALVALKAQGYTFLIAEQNQTLTGMADKVMTLSGGVIQD
jgi:branched-chain amino acid transport system ATP-binding protein